MKDKDISLVSTVRKVDEKRSDLKNEKMIPAVVYGKWKENTVLKINAPEFLKVYKKAWESNIIQLSVDGKNREVLIQDFQRNPVTWDFIHVDFYEITAGQVVTTNIRIDFVGNSKAKKDDGAIIEEYIKELEVTVLPKNLVDAFEADLTLLEKCGDTIRVSDLQIDSSKFELANSDDDIVAIASEPKKVEIEETAPELEEVEVIWEDKKEEAKEEEK